MKRFITFKAESISLLQCRVEVPLDATEEEIQAIQDGLDGSDYEEYGTDWSNDAFYDDETAEVEVSLIGMTWLENGDASATDGLGDGAVPNFWDVMVLARPDEGEFIVLHEAEDMQEDEANRIFEAWCAEYPDAEHVTRY